MKEKQEAAKTANETAAPAKEAESKEAIYHFEVLPQPNGEPVKLGAMVCGPGAKGAMPETAAKAAEREGWVKLTGLKL